MYVAIGMAAMNMVSQIGGARSAAKAQRAAIRKNRKAARMKFSAVESSVNIMKAVNLEQTLNASHEILREGAARSRETQEAVESVAGTVLARSEGLTSGRSKGRQMVDLYVKGNKALMVNQLVDEQDKATNDLNNKLLSAHQELTTVLANEGGGATSGILDTLMAGAKGYQLGSSLQSAFSASGGPQIKPLQGPLRKSSTF